MCERLLARSACSYACSYVLTATLAPHDPVMIDLPQPGFNRWGQILLHFGTSPGPRRWAAARAECKKFAKPVWAETIEARLHLSVDGSAGLLKCTDDVSVPDGTDDVPVPALKVRLGVGKQEHENQSRYDTSGYDVLRHGWPVRRDDQGP